MDTTKRYSPEVRERAVRMVLEHEREYDSQWAAIRSISEKFGCTRETLRRWVRQAERDSGRRGGQTTEERERIKELERGNRELKRANEIFRKASVTAERPNQLWVSDLTYVAAWRGFVYVPFVVDAFSRRIVGCRASSSLSSDLALDALEQAIWKRQEASTDGLIRHSDHRSVTLSAWSGIEPSVGSRGDSYDNALARTIIGIYKTEVIRRRGLDEVELATLGWVWWFNHHRLLSSIRHVPPVEYEEQFDGHQTHHDEAVALIWVPDELGAIHIALGAYSVTSRRAPYSRSTFATRTRNWLYQTSRPQALRLLMFQVRVPAADRRLVSPIEMVIPSPSRADSMPRNPGCRHASSFIRAAMSA